MVYRCHAAPVSTTPSGAHESAVSKTKNLLSQDKESFVSCRYACGLVGEEGFRKGYSYLLQHFCCMQRAAWQVQAWVVEPSAQWSGQAGSPHRELEL